LDIDRNPLWPPSPPPRLARTCPNGTSSSSCTAITFDTGTLKNCASDTTGFAPAGFDGLEEADFERLLSHKPEVVLFGTGPAIRFPHPRLTRALTDARIGLEVMDTPAACRTFNILAAEGRSVIAALLVT